MKGRISLGDFIAQVRNELHEAEDKTGKPYFELNEVELEVTFGLEAQAGATAKLVVFEIGGEATATQSHKVTLKLTPIGRPPKEAPVSGGGGGGGGLLRTGPVFQRVTDR